MKRLRAILPTVHPHDRGERHRQLIASTRGLEPLKTAVVHPVDRNSLLGAIDAARAGLIVPVLVGPESRIRAAAAAESVDLAPYRLVPTRHSHEAAERAVALARAGEVEALMKGSLHTDELMQEVVAKETGLRTGRRISHVFVMDVPTCPRPPSRRRSRCRTRSARPGSNATGSTASPTSTSPACCPSTWATAPTAGSS